MQEYTEDALIEQPTISLFAELGYETIRAYDEVMGEHGTLGRADRIQVVLIPRLRAALQRLNQWTSRDGIEQAIEAITRDRSNMQPANANREIYLLLKDGVPVKVRDDSGDETTETVRVIDWNDPLNNDFLLVSQFWVTGEMHTRRADLVGFVNGLPLIVVELKAHYRHLEDAFNGNISDYKDTIPQLFWYNAAIIVSNGTQSKIGSLTAGWEYYFEWKKINDEGEQGVISLETLIRGVCDKARLLDIIENFTLFRREKRGYVKILARNHQYLGVNNAFEAVRHLRERQGRLGVFWHTQGSGKSFSMIFLAQKVFRKLQGNWTFLVVTDRDDLDGQIYKTFDQVGAVNEKEAQAESGEHLKQLLRENHHYVFTLIQKFNTNDGRPYPVLSERDDIIVMTDEAHRTQYATFAQNMRTALPNAAFLGFTGTPLMAGEEKTRAVFGDYVSIYNFRQSVEDGATVPLFYENRIPSLQLTNDELDNDIADVVEQAGLDDAQQAKLEREFARQYHLITRDDRLETIAADIVSHFLGHGEGGKAMVVAIDKMTAVRMYDKVKRHWQNRLEELKAQRLRTSSAAERDRLKAQIDFMQQTDMAVVVSQAQNEIADFKAKGLDIEPHRRRMVREDLEEKFKDPGDPLRIVFVCAMWMTGFDVPSLSTVYLDKPMRNHTLMQTIARANRVFGDKTSGVIVDYIGIFRNLQKALSIYGSSSGGGAGEGEMPIKDKSAQFAALEEVLTTAEAYCQAKGIDIAVGHAAQGWDRLVFLQNAGEILLVNDETRDQMISLANDVALHYRAILPDPAANQYAIRVALIVNIGRSLQKTLPEPDISGVLAAVEDVLNASIAAESYVIKESDGDYQTQLVDLSKLDPDKLKVLFAEGRRRAAAAHLRNTVAQRIKRMMQLNRSRTSYYERFQNLIEEYNAGSMNTEAFFDQLIKLVDDLNLEDQRKLTEQLSEEELAIFDLLVNNGGDLTDQERAQVKKVARDLLATLKQGKLVLDWRKKQQAKADVQLTIADAIDVGLPQRYTPEMREHISANVFDHILTAYRGDGQTIYTSL